MKPLGRIAYEQFCEEEAFEEGEFKNWMFLHQFERDAWTAAVQAAIEEYERRKDDDNLTRVKTDG